MNTIQSRVVSAGLFFLAIFAFGFWLSSAGTGRSSLVLAIHKLATLGAIIWLGRTVYLAKQADGLGPLGLLPAGMAGLFFLGTIATGGLLSTEETMPALVLKLHQITPYLTVVSTVATLYLLPR